MGDTDNNLPDDILGALKGDVAAYADITMDVDITTGDMFEIAMGVFNRNADQYERQGINVDDIIMAIGSMRIV